MPTLRRILQVEIQRHGDGCGASRGHQPKDLSYKIRQMALPILRIRCHGAGNEARAAKIRSHEPESIGEWMPILFTQCFFFAMDLMGGNHARVARSERRPRTREGRPEYPIRRVIQFAEGLRGRRNFLRRRETYGAELPQGVLYLTAAVDTQDNRLEYEVCGWGEEEECWGIRKGVILGSPGSENTWAQLDAVLDHPYSFADGKNSRSCGRSSTPAAIFHRRYTRIVGRTLQSSASPSRARAASRACPFMETNWGKQKTQRSLW